MNQAELHYFENAYFDVWHPLYPFLDEEAFHSMLERLHSEHHSSNSLVAQAQDAATSMDLAQSLLVLALGAQIV